MLPEKGKTGRYLVTPTGEEAPRDVATARWRVPLATALRGALREGYGWRQFRADAASGLVVGIVALPLAMALAIACGVAPQHGIYTAIVAGGLIAVTGGSRFNVSGPTAAFVILLAPISAQYGLGGLAIASLMAGALLVLMGLLRLGRLIQFVPYPVTTGFTAGIAVVIASLQFKDFLGLDVAESGERIWHRFADLAAALPTFAWQDIVVGALCLLVLLLWPRLTHRLPAPLVAVVVAAGAAYALARFAGVEAATIASRFTYSKGAETLAGVPAAPPLPVLPWLLPGADGQPLGLSWQLLTDLLWPALAIAVLGAMESLLAAVVADGMTGTRHDPDAELIGQGIGNLAVPFFGGFAATGAIARTATNVRSGGRTPVAALIHSLFLLLAVLLVAPWLGYLPMAAMAALLLVVAWNMADARHFGHILRVAPRSDVAVLLTCFLLTVLFDMVIAVGVGIVLAAMLFMRRMAEISGARLVSGEEKARTPLPPGVVMYEIAGPLFFGAADKAAGAITTTDKVKVVLLEMSGVPAMDVTGLVALESVLTRLRGGGARVMLVGLRSQPRKVLQKAAIEESPAGLEFCVSVEHAISLLARET
jgi:sulfate permease, SulP family